MENAVEAWAEDLNYVSQYNIEQQRTIWVNSFASKYTGQKAAFWYAGFASQFKGRSTKSVERSYLW